MTAPPFTAGARGRTARLVAPPGVYRPQDDTRLLLRALVRERIGPGTRMLEIGTGSGALAVRAARTGARVTAVDLSWLAVFTTRLNAALARQPVTVRHGDLTAPVTGRTYDMLVSNPPYVPAAHHRDRRWDGGPDGRALVDRICDAAGPALRPGGVLLMVHSGLCDAHGTLSRLARAGLDARITDRARVPYGPVLRSRRAWLRERGLPHATGTHEELVIIRAER